MISVSIVKKMHDYFISLIEEGKQEIDILECNADLHDIISGIPGIDGWIPVEERFPEPDEYVLISFENFALPLVGRYEADQTGGAFYVGDDEESCAAVGLFVNAWMPLPEPYKEEP